MPESAVFTRFLSIDRPERLTYRLIRGLHDRPRNGNADIYWVDASVVTSLRSKAVFR